MPYIEVIERLCHNIVEEKVYHPVDFLLYHFHCIRSSSLGTLFICKYKVVKYEGRTIIDKYGFVLPKYPFYQSTHSFYYFCKKVLERRAYSTTVVSFIA